MILWNHITTFRIIKPLSCQKKRMLKVHGFKESTLQTLDLFFGNDYYSGTNFSTIYISVPLPQRGMNLQGGKKNL